MKVRIVHHRRDGKTLVQLTYAGGPNGFGGEHHGKVINKIVNPEQLSALIKRDESFPPHTYRAQREVQS